jgi:hypothetical protein
MLTWISEQSSRPGLDHPPAAEEISWSDALIRHPRNE